MNILLLQGHPDAGQGHLCDALAAAYAEGAQSGGHRLRRLVLNQAPVTLLRSEAEWKAPPPAYAQQAQQDVLWADHIVLVFPLWMGGMPALVKAWFEQVFRENFAMEVTSSGVQRHLKGKSARLIVTMGMPALFYRWYFGQPGTRQLRRSMLGFSGISPVRQSLIGMVDRMPQERAAKLKADMHSLGAAGR